MRSSTEKDYYSRLTRVLIYIQNHLNEELSLDELAEVAHFSSFHFHRIFKAMVGESVKEHVRRLRLERSAILLTSTDRTILDLALEAGYESHEAFSRAFKNQLGLPPSQFRTEHRDLKRSASSFYSPDGKLTQESIPWSETPEPEMEVKIQSIPKLTVAFVRNVGPYDDAQVAWDKLLPYLGSQGWLGADSKYIGLCHDDPDITPEDKIRYDACVTVNSEFKAEGEIQIQVIPASEYAVTTHLGPYEKLTDTYRSLFGHWLPQSGREPSSQACLEIYLNDPESTDPADLITDVHVPLVSLK